MRFFFTLINLFIQYETLYLISFFQYQSLRIIPVATGQKNAKNTISMNVWMISACRKSIYSSNYFIQICKNLFAFESRCMTGLYWDSANLICSILFNLISKLLSDEHLGNITSILIQADKKTYSSPCTATDECQTDLGLICATEENTCLCPLGMHAHSCDCPSNMFYDYGRGCGKFQNHRS
jgi:hypothetical protein